MYFLLLLLSTSLLITLVYSTTYTSFSQKYSGFDIDLLTPTQVQGFEVVLKIIKTKYMDDIQVETDCKVIDQRLSHYRRVLKEETKLVKRQPRKMEANNIFIQKYYIAIDFTISWSSNSMEINQSIYANKFVTYMNSEEGYRTILDYMKALGLRFEQVYPLRTIEPEIKNVASALPPSKLDPTSQPSLVVERFSVTLIGHELEKLSTDQLTAFEVFLSLFTSDYGLNGGEPNVSTTCEIEYQELSLTLLRHRKMKMNLRRLFRQDKRDLESNRKYYIDIKFSMMWTTSIRQFDLVADNYLDDFMNYMNSDIGMNSLIDKLKAVGVLVDDISTLRIVYSSV